MQKFLLLDLQDSFTLQYSFQIGAISLPTYLALKGSGMRFDGFADHLVTESLYLRDPKNNGIEIYRDRPSEEWPRDTEGRLVMDALPLNLQTLLSEMNKGESNNKIIFLT